MDILVLGGTYFLGKAFVEGILKKEATDNKVRSITLVNRGSKSAELKKACEAIDIKEHHMDRHDASGWEKLDKKNYDVVVDFCGYNEGDIRLLFEAGIRTRQYVFISTVDVYSRENPEADAVTEDYPYELRRFPGPVGDYISGKVVLEQELKALASKYGFKYTVFRPAVIYGPGNYAERESMYFKWMVNAGQILSPVDATGYFQLVFVKDVADIIRRSLLNDTAFDRAYNVCTNEKMNYKAFADVLKKVAKSVLGREIEEVEITTDMVLERQLPLPFPLFKEESYFYDGSRSKEISDGYTDLCEGLCESLREWMN